MIPQIDFSRVGSYNAETVWRELETAEVNRIMAAPGFLQQLINYARQNGVANNRVTAVHTGGAPIFTTLIDELKLAFPLAQVIAIYGSTEAEPIAVRNVTELDDVERRIIAGGGGLPAGKVVQGVTCRVIRNSYGKTLDELSESEFAALNLDNEVGEIVVAGENILAGYLNGIGDRENKFSVAGQRFHRTGDLGRFDANGQLWLQGRASQAIDDAKGRLYPLSVEAAVKMIISVEQLALVRYRGRRTLVLEAKSISEEVKRNLLEHLSWAQLEEITCVAKMPVDRRHNSKVDYAALQQLLARR